MRASTLFLASIGLGTLTLCSLFASAAMKVTARMPALERTAAHVARLEITDLCLFSEARYTRHLSMADLHTPFQEFPLSLEHFPTGSLVAPPAHLARGRGSRD